MSKQSAMGNKWVSRTSPQTITSNRYDIGVKSRLEHTELKCVDLKDNTTQELNSSSLDSASSVTEGKAQERQQQITMLTHNSFRSD